MSVIVCTKIGNDLAHFQFFSTEDLITELIVGFIGYLATYELDGNIEQRLRAAHRRLVS